MRYLVVIVTAIVILSCKKTGLNYVRGTVYDNGNGEPISGATVYLKRFPTKNFKSVIDSAKTNENGEYKLNFSKKIRSDYYLSCKCAGYFDVPESNDELEHGKNAINLFMSAQSYMQVRFMKTGNSNTFLCGATDDSYFSSFTSPLPSTPWPGNTLEPFDISLTVLIPSNRMTILKWATITRDTALHYNYYFPYGDMTNSYAFYAKKGDTLKYTLSFN